MRIRFLNCPLDLISHEDILNQARAALTGGRRLRVEGLNVAKLVECRTDPKLFSALEEAELVHIDGAGVAISLKLMGVQAPARRAGIDLMKDFCRVAASAGAGVYLLGARSEVVAKAAANLEREIEDLTVSGFSDGYFSESEEYHLVQKIRQSGAKLLFIGISSPKKEVFLQRNWSTLGIDVAMGVGGSFDVISGILKRAPRWMQVCALEWMFRLLQEPRRLWKRYWHTNFAFLLIVLKAKRVRR